ncbi:MAG: glycosyltransferase family 2 protein [Gammaproteobacteria bacterium]|jgi:hypothetical protein
MNGSVCTVTTLKAPFHETVSFVNYHINTGVDHLFLFFDDPADPAIDFLGKYRQVTCVKCDDSYWSGAGQIRPESIEDRQVANANNAFIRARSYGYCWIIHIDSDELVFPDTTTDRKMQGLNPAGIRGLLAQVPENVHVVVFDMREGVPEELAYENVFREVSLFKVPPSKEQEKRMSENIAGNALFLGEYFRGHKSSKSAVRLSAPVGSMGLSSPVRATTEPGQLGDARVLVVKEFRALKLLHFDCCDYEAWKNKWERRIDGTATASYMRPNRKRQLEEFRNIYTNNSGALVDLYKRMYFLDEDARQFLMNLGVLARFRIDGNLFAAPA